MKMDMERVQEVLRMDAAMTAAPTFDWLAHDLPASMGFWSAVAQCAPDDLERFALALQREGAQLYAFSADSRHWEMFAGHAEEAAAKDCPAAIWARMWS